MPTLLFGALPCIGGSPYVNLNWHLGPATRGKIRAHWAIFHKLWANFMLVAQACRANGGSISFEWPRRCAYWHKRSVKTFMREYGIQEHHLDGCAFGLVSHAPRTMGMPIRKPWTIVSYMPSFASLHRGCPHTPDQHAKCAGTDTRLTEGYTDELATAIHHAWHAHVSTPTTHTCAYTNTTSTATSVKAFTGVSR